MRSLVLARRFHAAPLVFALFLAGCGGGGGGGGGGSTPPTPQGKPSVAPANAQITSIAAPVTVTLSEPGYSGTFSVNASACAGIASVLQSPSGTSYTITGIAPGQCAVSFTDTFSQSVALAVSVTVSQVVAK